jgi:hypothetical protein
MTTLAARRALPHAIVFATAATIGFIPGTYGLMMAAATLVLLVPVLPVWTFGTALGFGYWLYALGYVRGPDRRWLWGATALYNAAATACWGAWGAQMVARELDRGAGAEGLLPLLPALTTAALTALAVDAWRRDARAD